jgi:alkylation response protein AidB-like acyl-CoA dehydrogenase
MVSAAVALVEYSKADASVGFTLDAHWLSADTILYFGTEEQKKEYLPRAARDMLCAIALTEASGGSDAANIKTTATRDGDHYVLNGIKTWCTNSEVAGYRPAGGPIAAPPGRHDGDHGTASPKRVGDSEGLLLGSSHAIGLGGLADLR